MSEQNKDLVRRHIELSWNKGKFNLLQQLVSKRFRYQTTFRDGFKNFDEYSDYVTEIRNSVPDLEVTIEEIMAEGDKVITFSTFAGSFIKALFGIPANGKVIAFSGASIWTIHKGKVETQTTMVDLMGLQRQLQA